MRRTGAVEGAVDEPAGRGNPWRRITIVTVLLVVGSGVAFYLVAMPGMDHEPPESTVPPALPPTPLHIGG